MKSTLNINDEDEVFIPEDSVPIAELVGSGEPWELKVVRISDPQQKSAKPAQRKRVVAYQTKRKFGYCELDESAYQKQRKLFWEQVVKPLQQAKAHVILTFDKIDRFSRDSSSEERGALTKLLRKGKIDMHFPHDNLFVHKDSPAADLFRLDIGVALAGYYSSAIRDNVKRRFEQKIADGEWCGKAPIGYKNYIKGFDAKGNPIKDIKLDTERHELVKEALLMRASGLSYGYITKHLQKAGLTSTVKNRPIPKTQVEYFLKNPWYSGNMRYEGKRAPHKYERLIEPAVWKQIQDVDAERSTRRTKHVAKEHLYRDLIKCATCGYSVWCDGPKKGGNSYLMCTQYGGKHGAIRLNEKVINAQVAKVLESIRIPEKMLPKLVADLQTEFDSEQEYYRRNVERLRKEYDKLDVEIKDAFRDRASFKIKPELFTEYIEELGQRQADLLEQIKDHSQGNERFVVSASKILEVASNASEVFLSDKVKKSSKRRLIQFVLTNLKLDGETLTFNLNSPFNTIALAAKNNSWGE